MGMETEAFNEQFDGIVQELMARSNGTFDEVFVQQLVANIAAELEDAPVQDFVRILVAKEAADEMRRLRGLQTLSS